MSTARALPATDALQSQFAKLYAEIKRLARDQRRREQAHSQGTTALVHDLFLAMQTGARPVFDDDRQFYAYAAKAMRHLLVDQARTRKAQKRGGDWARVDWADELGAPEQVMRWAEADRIEELQSALQRLESEDARAAEVLQLHVFAGLTVDKIAELLGLSSRTVERDWRFARSFLAEALGR
jgi:RNA polymerase sigma factor (TIGR02999 family)